MKAKAKPRAKRPLSAAKLQRREAIFALHRDFGPGRSYEWLIKVIKPRYGSVCKRTLVNWSREHNWQARLDEYDQRLRTSRSTLGELGPEFNLEKHLMAIAEMPNSAELISQIEVRTVRDVKTMVDVAEKLITLAVKLRKLGHGSQQRPEEARNQMRAFLEGVDRQVRAKQATEGLPVSEPVSDEAQSNSVIPKAPPSDTDDAATVH